MKTWNEVKKNITTISDEEKEDIKKQAKDTANSILDKSGGKKNGSRR